MKYIFGIMNFKYLINLVLFSVLALSHIAHANTGFLPPDQAFQFSAESTSNDKAQLKWKIAPHYYLYHDQFKVAINNAPVKLNLPSGHEKDDPTFGRTFVHYNQVQSTISVKPNSSYFVTWQGCAEDGLCYPLQRTTIKTDSDGLFPQTSSNANHGLNIFKQQKSANLIDDSAEKENKIAPTTAKKLIEKSPVEHKQDPVVDQPTVEKQVLNPQKDTETQSPIALTDEVTPETSTASTDEQKQDISTELDNKNINSSNVNENTSSVQWNDDSAFFHLLNKDSIFINLFIFLGLGVLLAFLPCSLPLIPILSGIIVQRASGYKAAAIALSFVISMAIVYSIMGIVVAEIGYSFQRWFQSPIIVSIFALFFVLLALNMFGLYQLALPQSIAQKLDRLQSKQKGGTFLGAIVMGMLSALIVGPCMSAPLAGALLFVSQSQSAFLGGLYLFILGLGIGLPLFIASVFGSKYLPKPGLWMDRLKVSFGFIMLMVAVYFFRPMLANWLYNTLFAALLIALAIYLLWIITKSQKFSHKIILSCLTLLCLGLSIWNIKNTVNLMHIENAEQHYEWTTVSTLDELNTAIAQAKSENKHIVLDVYADWCVACQPIEREVMPRKDVQTALQNFTRIKLDLSKYNASQDIILKNKQILGPPTVLFLNHDASEKRDLRLTGTFTAQELITQLNKAEP